MRGSFSIEASLIVPLVLAVMVLALRTGIDCYEETKAQVAKLGTRVSLILWIRCICWMRSQILEIYFMEIEYKRELTKSYMCVKTDQDFSSFWKKKY